MLRITVGLLALALFVAACATDGEEQATNAGVGETSTSSEVVAEPSGPDGEQPEDGAAGDTSGEADTDHSNAGDVSGEGDGEGGRFEDGTPEPLDGEDLATYVLRVLGGREIENKEAFNACLEDRGIDPGLSPLDADELETQAAALGVVVCAPDEVATGIAAPITPPPSTSAQDVECVIAETFRYIGTLPLDEAMAELDVEPFSQEVQEAVTPIVEERCSLHLIQIREIFLA